MLSFNTQREHDALLRALRYWEAHWDWECPILFGFESSHLTRVITDWPAENKPLSINALSAASSALLELLCGGSAIAKDRVQDTIGINDTEAQAILAYIDAVLRAHAGRD